MLIGLFALAASAGAAGPGGSLPNPCDAVPAADVAAALGVKQPPPSALAQVRNVATCSFAVGKLTVAVGYSTLVNPAPPAHTALVASLPHGSYMTFKGSPQTEIVFYEGSAATGVYGVVRAFVPVKEGRLVTVARALAAAIVSGSGAGATSTIPSVQLVSP